MIFGLSHVLGAGNPDPADDESGLPETITHNEILREFDRRQALRDADQEIREKKRRTLNARRPPPSVAEQKHRERVCFWTWPWGHAWEQRADGKTVCAGCGRITEWLR